MLENTEKSKDKQPLQEEKEAVKQEILTEAPKKTRGRPKKKVEVAPPLDMNAIEQEARFFLSMIQSGREMAGLDKPIGDMPATMFVQSYKGLVIKYGDVATKWMPEILFISSVGLILHDTYTEIKIKNAAQKNAAQDLKQEKKTKGKK